MINCPYCGKLTDPNLDSCPHCGGITETKTTAPARTSPKASAQTCPNCHALVQEGDIICVACGTNLLTGQKIAEERRQQEVAVERGGRKPLLIAGAGVLIVLVLIGAAYAFYALTRDPVAQATEMAVAGNLLEASELLKTHIVKHETDPRAHLTLGKVLWQMPSYAEAATHFKAAFDLEPANTDAGMLAVAAMAAANTPRVDQLAVLKDVVARQPDNQTALYLVALMKGAENDAAGEIADLRRVLELDPAGASQTRVSLAVALALSGQIEDARAELQAASGEGDPAQDLAAAWGFAANLGGDTETAEQQLRAALDGQTSVREDALTRLGILLVQKGDYGDALSYLNQAATANKNNRTARFFYALCLEQSKLDTEALNEFDTLAREGGEWDLDASLRAADLFLKQDDIDKARESVDRAERLGGATPAFFAMRGRVLMKAGEDGAAREAFQRAIAADPGYAPAHLELGLVHIRGQRFDDALVELNRFIELLGPASSEMQYEEIRSLITQIQQAMDSRGATPAGSSTGREES